MKKVAIVAIIVLLLSCGIGIGVSGFGTGDGSGEGKQNLDDPTEEREEKQDKKAQGTEVIIRVEENKIYVGEEECVDIEDFEDKISKISSQKVGARFVFEHEYAIKATYDDVKRSLINLEETLGISINYKE